VFLTSELGGGELLASFSGSFPPEEDTGTHWLECWIGPRASLDVVAKRKILPYQEFNPDHPAHKPGHSTN
jgi:hypothetical protein